MVLYEALDMNRFLQLTRNKFNDEKEENNHQMVHNVRGDEGMVGYRWKLKMWQNFNISCRRYTVYTPWSVNDGKVMKLFSYMSLSLSYLRKCKKYQQNKNWLFFVSLDRISMWVVERCHVLYDEPLFQKQLSWKNSFHVKLWHVSVDNHNETSGRLLNTRKNYF